MTMVNLLLWAHSEEELIKQKTFEYSLDKCHKGDSIHNIVARLSSSDPLPLTPSRGMCRYTQRSFLGAKRNAK
jgi:hypothetical protein